MPTSDLSRLINRELASLSDELLAYPDEQAIWTAPAGFPNSAGNLALHLDRQPSLLHRRPARRDGIRSRP